MRRLINIPVAVFIALFLGACNTGNAPGLQEEEGVAIQLRVDSTRETVQEERQPFELYYHRLVMALASGDGANFNTMIHPEYGCYLIESPGAVPAFTRITDVGAVFRKGSERPVLDFNNAVLAFALSRESLPTVDCDSPDGYYSKEGTFMADVNTLADGQIWKYAGLAEQEQDSIANLAATVSKTVVNTGGFTAYFSNIKGEWYLTFFDIRVPCSA